MSGLDINNFMLVDFRGFKRIVDAVGGVEICLSEPVDDPLSGLKLDKGKHVVQGEEALAFVRARKTLGDGSDTSRIRRQQAFLSSLMRKVLSSGTLLNPLRSLGVLNAATESLTADPQLADINNLKDLALSLKDLRPGNVTFTTVPWTPNGDNATVSVNTEKAQPIWDAMKNDTPWPPKGAAGEDTVAAEDRAGEHPRQRAQRHADPGPGQEGGEAAAQAGLHRRGGRQRRDHRLHDHDGAVRPEVRRVGEDPRLRGEAPRCSDKKKKLESALNLIVGTDFTEIQDVEILDITQDYTAQVNTGDEDFCAS